MISKNGFWDRLDVWYHQFEMLSSRQGGLICLVLFWQSTIQKDNLIISSASI